MNQLISSDLAEIHGGFAPLIVWAAGVAGVAICDAHFSNIIDNWADFKSGFASGFNAVAN